MSPLGGSGVSQSGTRVPAVPPSAAPCPSGRPGSPLTFPSPPPRVWPARRAAPGQGRGARGGGAGLGGEQQGEGWGCWHGAQGGRGGSGQPQGPRANTAEPEEGRGERGRGGAPGPGAGGGELQPAGPAREPGEARKGGLALGEAEDPSRGSLRLTNQSGPAEPGHCRRRCGARDSPARPAPPAAGRLGSARAGVAGGAAVIRLRARAARAGAGAGARAAPHPGLSSPARRPPAPAARSPRTVTSSGSSVGPSLPASPCVSPSPGVCRVSLSTFLSQSLPLSPALLLAAPVFSASVVLILLPSLLGRSHHYHPHSLLSFCLPSLSTPPCSRCSGGLCISPALKQQPQPRNQN